MSEIRVPFPDPIEPDDTIADVHDAIRKSPELDDGERELAEAVVVQALERGTTRPAQLIAELEGTGAREIVDKARQSLGMNTVGEQEAAEEFERANQTLVGSGRDADGRAFMVCAAEDCHAFPLSEQGVPTPVLDRVWWCEAHKDQAGPDDHLPPEPKYRIDPATMGLVAIGEERERFLEEDRERKRKAAEREQRRREEAKALAEVEGRYVEQAKPINIAGWQVRPDGRIVDDR
jgi:hypothetical protein